MRTIDTWGDAIVDSTQNLGEKFINFLPQVLAALVVLIVGLLLAGAVDKLAKKIMTSLKIDNLLETVGIKPQLEKFGMTFTFADLIGWLLKWFVIISVWIAVLQVLNLTQVGALLENLVLYLPNVITAVIILAIGLVGGQFLFHVVEKSIIASNIGNNAAGTLAALAKWAVIIFAFLASLSQLGIATELIRVLFTGLVAMIAIAGGLAFGLGGKERAAKLLESLENETKTTHRN